MIFKVIHSL